MSRRREHRLADRLTEEPSAGDIEMHPFFESEPGPHAARWNKPRHDAFRLTRYFAVRVVRPSAS